MNKFDQFIFESYQFNRSELRVDLNYSLEGHLKFTETISWNDGNLATDYSELALESALKLLHLTLGVSYYKAYLPKEIIVKTGQLNRGQADYFNDVYSNGLGEFIYRNNLKFSDIAMFESSDIGKSSKTNTQMRESKALVPMSGGKDSILTAEILKTADINFRPLFMTTDGNYPEVLNDFGQPILVKRQISKQLIIENEIGAMNGHVPFSAILDSILAVTAVLYGFSDVVLSHESSADEATVRYDGREVNHQYSKSSKFEKRISSHVKDNISNNLEFFSLIRNLSELDIHELFVSKGLFSKYRGKWSSCNIANYRQGQNTTDLKWCGKCSKCANAFLLFAPFVNKNELIDMFSGNNLATDPDLKEDIEGLLGMTESKPFECVGEINELRSAVNIALKSGNWPELAKYSLALQDIKMPNQEKIEINDNYSKALEEFLIKK